MQKPKSMPGNDFYAVLTGDLVDSSKLSPEHRQRMLEILKEAFAAVDELLEPAGFEIYRGDSFQGLVKDPSRALEASLVIRSTLRMDQPDDAPVNWDARTAIGIGTLENLPERVSEGTGEAYRRSGPLLDDMKGDRRLRLATPWEEIDEELNTQAALLDAVIAKWSPGQAEVVCALLGGRSRKEIGRNLGISQAAVHYRVKGAGWTAVERFLERYRAVLKSKISA